MLKMTVAALGLALAPFAAHAAGDCAADGVYLVPVGVLPAWETAADGTQPKGIWVDAANDGGFYVEGDSCVVVLTPSGDDFPTYKDKVAVTFSSPSLKYVDIGYSFGARSNTPYTNGTQLSFTNSGKIIFVFSRKPVSPRGPIQIKMTVNRTFWQDNPNN